MANDVHPHPRTGSGAHPAADRACDWPGCVGEGMHRAPRSRLEIRSYHWFCLDHARQYNAGWNYDAGMSDAEVEADVRRDTVWERPSWPLGGAPRGRDGGRRFAAGDVLDRLGAFGPEWDADGGFAKRPDARAPAGTRQAWAVAVFALSGPVTTVAVKARYKELVKRHHPDANGGAKSSEEKIKEINEAYRIILDMLGT
jgi:hypothetical protein